LEKEKKALRPEDENVHRIGVAARLKIPEVGLHFTYPARCGKNSVCVIESTPDVAGTVIERKERRKTDQKKTGSPFAAGEEEQKGCLQILKSGE